MADDVSLRIFLALQRAIESSHRFEAAVAEHVDMHRTDIAALTQLMEAHSVDEPLSPSDLDDVAAAVGAAADQIERADTES